MPTTTRSPIDSSAEIWGECSRGLRSGELTAQRPERKTRPGEIVLHAALHEGRSMHRAPRRELLRREPMQRENLPVERAPWLGVPDVSAKREAQKRHVLRCVVPAIDAEQRRGRESMRRLFQHLARDRGNERLARIEMAGRLVEHPATLGFLLDEEEATFALDDRRDRYRGLPDAHAALRVFLRMNASMRATPCSICSLDAA